MLKQEGMQAVDIARACKRREDWVRRTVRPYNSGGAGIMLDFCVENGGSPLLSSELRLGLLHAAEHEEPPDGGLWTSPRVAQWMRRRAGLVVADRTGLAYLRRLGFRKAVPRPRHPDTDTVAQGAFRMGGASRVRRPRRERLARLGGRSLGQGRSPIRTDPVHAARLGPARTSSPHEFATEARLGLPLRLRAAPERPDRDRTCTSVSTAAMSIVLRPFSNEIGPGAQEAGGARGRRPGLNGRSRMSVHL
jgi:hypothetical protein